MALCPRIKYFGIIFVYEKVCKLYHPFARRKQKQNVNAWLDLWAVLSVVCSCEQSGGIVLYFSFYSYLCHLVQVRDIG